jgi:hypothetical protein
MLEVLQMFVGQLLATQMKVDLQGIVILSDLSHRATQLFNPRDGLCGVGRRLVGHDRRGLPLRVFLLGRNDIQRVTQPKQRGGQDGQ